MARYVRTSIITALSLELALAPAWAAYDHPITWSDMSTLDLRPVFRSQYASNGNLLEPIIPQSATELVLRDADNRVGAGFRVPDSLRAPVEFWLKIYTEYTTQHVAILDAKHPEMVYEVLDFRKLAQNARNRMVYEIISRNRVKAKVHAYRKAFQDLEKNPRPKKPSREQANILAARKLTQHKHPFSFHAHNLRTQTGQRDNIVKGLLAAESYFPKMEKIFQEMGLPSELTRLSLVESSFNMNATSRVGAAGVWQFMPLSAKEYLSIDDQASVDERLSPLKSTMAAAKLLKRNHKILGTWPLAVTAYNHGVRGLPRWNRKAEAIKSCDLFAPCKPKKGRLGWASRNYYAEFLAVLYAEAYRSLFYGDPPHPSMRPIAFLKIGKNETGLSIAMNYGVSMNEFHFLNPDIRNIHKKLPNGLWIAVPAETDDLSPLTGAETFAVRTNKGRRGLPRREKT